HGDLEGVGRLDRLVVAELSHQLVGLGGVGPAEDRTQSRLDVPELVVSCATAEEISPISVIGDGDDRPGYRHPRFETVVVLSPFFPERLDLSALLDMERLAGLVRLDRKSVV